MVSSNLGEHDDLNKRQYFNWPTHIHIYIERVFQHTRVLMKTVLAYFSTRFYLRSNSSLYGTLTVLIEMCTYIIACFYDL